MTTIPKYSMQVSVPHRHYGECEWFMPSEMVRWLNNIGLKYSMCGRGTLVTGYSKDGISNRETIYMINDITSKEDCLVFKIQFPFVSTYVSEQIDWKKVYAEHALRTAQKETKLKRRRDLYAAKKKSIS